MIVLNPWVAVVVGFSMFATVGPSLFLLMITTLKQEYLVLSSVPLSRWGKTGVWFLWKGIAVDGVFAFKSMR